MRHICLGLTAAAVLFSSGVVHSAEPTTAASYHQQLRNTLTERAWAITRDDAGLITAERLYLKPNGVHGPHYAGTLDTYARLQIYLQNDGKGHPAGSAYTSYCLYGRPNKSYLVYPPSALRDPKLNQEYHEVVAEAKSRLVSGTSDRIAME